MDIEINENYKRVYIPMIFTSAEVFKANGEIVYLPCASVPIMGYLTSENKYYLKDGKTLDEYNVVPMWTQNNLDGQNLVFDDIGVCTNDVETVDFIFDDYKKCERYCVNTLNQYIMDIRLRDWKGVMASKIYDRLVVQQKDALDLANEQNVKILSLIEKEK